MEKKGEDFICRGSWLSLKRVLYRTRSGTAMEWEVIVRSRQETVVIIVARLVPSGRHLLIRQFRPGINRPVISLPAGCVNPGIDPAGHAARELKEETGYLGRVVRVSPPLKINPAVLDCDLRVVEMEIAETDPANLRPRQELEPEEEIEVALVEPGKLEEFFRAEAAAGCEIDAGCWLALRGASG